MRAMPKTLDTQGFSGLREEVVRSEGRPSRSPVQQALITTYCNFETAAQFGRQFFAILYGLQTVLLERLNFHPVKSTNNLPSPNWRREVVSATARQIGIYRSNLKMHLWVSPSFILISLPSGNSTIPRKSPCRYSKVFLDGKLSGLHVMYKQLISCFFAKEKRSLQALAA